MRTPLPSEAHDILPTGFDPSGFVGEIIADGQRIRTTAVATDTEGRVAFLGLVGYETSVSAALALLMKGKQIGFIPATRLAWDGPTSLEALRVSYWLWRAEVRGTREKQGVAFPRSASIDHGLRTPPTLPTLSPDEEHRRRTALADDPFAETRTILEQLRQGIPDPNPLQARIILAAPENATPTPAAIFGHLKGLRVITLPRLAWIDELWTTGLHYGLITPLAALGIRAWRLDGDPRHWNALVSDAIQHGRLPTTRPTDADLQRLGRIVNSE
jgi:hypothetical protein